MTEREDRTVECGEHGALRAAYVCTHLVRALRVAPPEPIGFYRPDPDGSNEDRFEGWCAQCDERLLEAGEWNDEIEAFAEITLICSGCYGKLALSQRRT